MTDDEIENLKDKIKQLENDLEKQKKISNAMKTRIKHSMQFSSTNYSMFESNILLQNETERRTEKLQKEKEKSELESISKSDFFSSMSHELRSPMHAILSLSNFGKVKYKDADREKLGKYFVSISQSGNRLLRLIDDLLDLAKLESGKFEIEVKKNNLHELLKNVFNINKELLLDKNITLDLDDAGDVESAEFDADRITQVIQNLLSNAIKFSPADSTITVCCKNTKLDDMPAVQLSISDQGVGVPDAELGLVFEKYIQSSLNQRKKGGTGLGLPICKELISLHYGKIWAENNLHKGSCFSFILPLIYVEEESDAA